MIETFECQTEPLNTYEKEILLPVIIRGLSNKIGKAKAITGKQICDAMNKYGYRLNGARLRKIVNHIRVCGLINNLIATSDGYYIATSVEDVDKHIESLKGRIAAMQTVLFAMENQRNKL